MSALSRRLVTSATAVLLLSGVGTGVASAETTTGWASTKASIADGFSCKNNPNFFYCR